MGFQTPLAPLLAGIAYGLYRCAAKRHQPRAITMPLAMSTTVCLCIGIVRAVQQNTSSAYLGLTWMLVMGVLTTLTLNQLPESVQQFLWPKTDQ